MKRIVLTGGPGAGKTVISAQLVSRHPSSLVLVPEAATQVYELLKTRWDRLTVDGRRDVQRRIYQLQIEQEPRIAAGHPNHNLLLDRGTVDGAAYWPDGPEDYWQQVGTSFQAELDRYDVVIWMESAAVLGLYDGDRSNIRRYEDAAAAIERGNLVLKLWGAHRNLKRVGAFNSISEKIAAVEDIVLASCKIPG